MSPQRNNDVAESSFDLVVESIYRAAAGDIDWNDALATILRVHGAERAMLFTPGLAPADGGLSSSHDATSRRGALHAVNGDGEAPQPQPEPSYSVALDGAGDASMPSTFFVLFRGRHAAHLDADERASLESTVRHLSLGVRLWYRGHAPGFGAEALASSLHAAALLVDATLRVHWMNASAGQWVREGKLAVANGRLAQIVGVDADLARLAREATGPGVRALVASSGATTFELAPVSAASTGRPGLGLALLLVRNGSGSREAAASLATRYRLTSSEVDLAIALWKGVLIAEYAALRSVAMSTVRTQLKALLAKTGARRQSDVVAIVARLQPIAGASHAGAMARVHYDPREKRTSGDTSNGG